MHQKYVDGAYVQEDVTELFNVVKEINLARTMGCSNPGHMFMKMWIFIHGAACMTLSGDFDLTDEETISLLEKSYESFARE